VADVEDSIKAESLLHPDFLEPVTDETVGDAFRVECARPRLESRHCYTLVEPNFGKQPGQPPASARSVSAAMAGASAREYWSVK
jgi:hypothetical protein